jgi:translation initiation factor 3 subunit J
MSWDDDTPAESQTALVSNKWADDVKAVADDESVDDDWDASSDEEEKKGPGAGAKVGAAPKSRRAQKEEERRRRAAEEEAERLMARDPEEVKRQAERAMLAADLAVAEDLFGMGGGTGGKVEEEEDEDEDEIGSISVSAKPAAKGAVVKTLGAAKPSAGMRPVSELDVLMPKTQGEFTRYGQLLGKKAMDATTPIQHQRNLVHLIKEFVKETAPVLRSDQVKDVISSLSVIQNETLAKERKADGKKTKKKKAVKLTKNWDEDMIEDKYDDYADFM